MKNYSAQTMEEFHVHLKTKNTSFLKMAALLISMGVKNAWFHLQLHDKGLEDIDPYDPDLDQKWMVRVLRECSINRWYFYREIFRVTEAGASVGVGGGIPFILNRGNLAYLWASEMNISTYLIMPRQTGKTWAAIADDAWTYQFNRGATILHFNKNQKDANENLYRISTAISMIPMYLQHSADENLDASDKKMVRNQAKLIRNRLGSTIEAMASAGNEAKADAMARGRTASKIWYDEIAFIFFNETLYTSSTPAYEKAADSAMKNGVPYGISITTTPGDLATPHGAFAYKMMNNAIRFDESFYDFSAKKLYKIVYKTPDKIPFLFMQYSYLQLGETDEWYLDKYKRLNNPLQARREYLLEWMNSNGNSPFDPDDIDLVGELARQKAVMAKHIRLNSYFEMTIYDEYHGKKPVLIGVDVAGSIGRDSSAIVVANPETLHPIAIFKSNMIELSKLRKLIMTIVKKLYPHCILTIENNSVGKGLIDELRETPVNRVLYKERKKKAFDVGAKNATKKRVRDVIEYGHNTNTVTRPQMMETLESVVHNSPAHVGYPELYEEIRFLELKNGRIDHSSTTHDDVTMAYMGILWIVRYGTGLKGRQIYYNISDGQDDFEEYEYDTAASRRFADRLLRGTKSEQQQAEDEFLEFMLTEHPVLTSADLKDRERQEYFKARDKIDGIIDDEDTEDFTIEDSTDRLILSASTAFLNRNSNIPDETDPLASLLAPSWAESSQNERNDWTSDYSW